MRRLAAIGAAAGLTLVAAACGGAPAGEVAQTGATSSAVAQVGGAVAFARCMRSHGVSAFPDPSSSGQIPKVALERLGVSSARFQAAQRACEQLLPNGGRPPSQAQRQRVRAQGLRYAQCMRAHGVPNMPDPDSSGRIPDPASVHIDQGSPTFRAANQACAKDRPPYIPSNAAYDAWASSHPGSG